MKKAKDMSPKLIMGKMVELWNRSIKPGDGVVYVALVNGRNKRINTTVTSVAWVTFEFEPVVMVEGFDAPVPIMRVLVD